MIADVDFPIMTDIQIDGTLELWQYVENYNTSAYMNYTLKCKLITIATTGNLLIGTEEQPLYGDVNIVLYGDQYYRHNKGRTIGKPF